jgi:hypothetical protein
MCTISFDKEALNITIHNLYPSLELASPIYCSNGTTCHVSPSRQTDIGNTIEASFGIYPKQEYSLCTLLYKLQSKHITKTDHQSNSSTVSIKDTATTSMYLLVVWHVNYQFHDFYVCIIECTDDFTWDEDKLWALYWQYYNQFRKDYKYNIITWLMHGEAVMKTKLDVTYGSNYKLNIIITEGICGHNIEEPISINPKRLVLSLQILIMLMYTVSLCIRPSFKLDIHNQCLNIDLVSPTYITDYRLECHRPPDYKVYTGNTMRSGFIVYSPCQKPSGILICKLQKRPSHESAEIGEGTSSTIHLLVVWGISKYKNLYVDVLLVKHDKGFDWNENDLRELCYKNINRFRLCPNSVTEIWSLYDDTTLATISEIMNEGQLLNIIISEIDISNCVRMPVHINPER